MQSEDLIMRKKNISKKVYSKKLVAAMLASMMLMTGCGSAASETEEITRASKNQVTEKVNENKKDFMTIKGFVPLSAMKEECKFEKTVLNPEDKEEYPDIKMEAEYSLSGGSNDKITVTYISKKWESKLSVNDSTVDCPIEIITDAMIIDIDSTDNHKEIAILGVGPALEPVVFIYGYVDGKLYNYGDYQGADEYDEILFDKKGKFIDIGCYDYFIAEKYLYKYHQIKDNAACEIAVDYKSALNREYTILKDIYVAFGETDNIKFDNNLVDYTNVFKLKVGDKIVIIDEQKNNGLYYVQLPDGRKGLLSREVWVDTEYTETITTDGFMPISEAKEDYKFTKDTKWSEGSAYPDTIFVGEYALNSDKKDKIVVTNDGLRWTGKIAVNDIEIETELVNVEDVVIIDVDKNDGYKEIAILDNGPSADYTVVIFRYAEGKLYELGWLGAVSDFEQVLFNKDGKAISSYNYTYFLDTKVVIDYNMVIEGKLHKVINNYESDMNKKYAVKYEKCVAFGETENMEISLDLALDVCDYQNLVRLNAGDEIVIIKANPSEEVYYVELPDGRKGVMTTRVAG